MGGGGVAQRKHISTKTATSTAMSVPPASATASPAASPASSAAASAASAAVSSPGCGSGYDCIAINGRRWDDPSRIAVCRPSHPDGHINKCQNGRSTATCGRSIDCIAPGGAATKGVCRKGRCQLGLELSSCGRNHDCICNSCSMIGGDSGGCTTSYCHGKMQRS